MIAITHLSKAPITEAIIDFKVEPPKEIPDNLLPVLKRKLQNDYPHVDHHTVTKSEIQIIPGEQKVVTHPPENLGLHGYFFRSEDRLNVAQFRTDGFTFNRLKPYTSWANIFSEAQRLWNLYLEAMSPAVVATVSTRYINSMQFQLPLPTVENYFKIHLPIPEEIPKTFSNFLSRITVFDEETKNEATVTFLMDAIKDTPQGRVILDIDAHRSGPFSPTDLEELWQIFESLREMKNRIFFGYITEKTVEAFR